MNKKDSLCYLRNWLVHIYKYRKNNNLNYLVNVHVGCKQYEQLRLYWSGYVKDVIESCKKAANSERLNKGEVCLEAYSIISKATGDLYGKVIKKNNVYYRAIRSEKREEYNELWKTGLLQGLMINKLIPNMKITNFYIEGFDLVFEIEKVDISYANMWSYSMIKDAMLCTSIIKKVADYFGYYLVDGHSNNLTFFNGRAMWIDVGSIELRRGRDISCGKEMMMTMGYSLLFFSIGNSFLSKKLLYDEEDIGGRIFPTTKEDSYREFVAALKMFKKYHVRSGIRTEIIIHHLFDELNIEPFYIDYLFHIDMKHSVQNIIDSQINSTAWVSVLYKMNIHVERSAGIGYNSEYLITDFFNSGVCKKGIILKFDEKDAEECYLNFKKKQYPFNVYTYNWMFKTYDKYMNEVKSDLIYIDDILNNMYVIGHCDMNDIWNRLSQLTSKYLMFSYYPYRKIAKEILISERYVKDIMMRSLKKLFRIINIQKNEDYELYLVEKNE